MTTTALLRALRNLAVVIRVVVPICLISTIPACSNDGQGEIRQAGSVATAQNGLPAATAPASADGFCADLVARHGPAIIRCVDFGEPADAAIYPAPRTRDVRLFDGTLTASGTTGGSLGWRIKSFDQIKTENPSWSNGRAWQEAVKSHTGVWQRWLGRNTEAGTTYYFQFKYRFNRAFKTWWGGGGPKVFGLDAGCRIVNGHLIPPLCEQGGLGTATSLETLTMTTTNWFPASVVNADARPYPVTYQGSSNFALTQGFTPGVRSTQYGTSSMEQPGPGSGWKWSGSGMVNTCNALDRYYNPDFVNKGICVTYGAPDAWHEITIALRPSGHYYDTNPKAPASSRVYRHDTLIKVWYDGKLIVNFDPDEPPFRPGQPSPSQCAALDVLHPAYDNCHTGADIFRDGRDVPVDCRTQQPSATGQCGSSYCVAPCPWITGDPGADLTQFILWTFSYRRGYPPRAWCDSVVGSSDPQYRTCVDLSGSADSPEQFEAFLHHLEVRVNMDDWVAATIALPMKQPTDTRPGPRKP